MRIIKLPRAVRSALGRVLGARGERRLSRLLEVLGEKPVFEYWRLAEARTRLRREEFDLWGRASLDAILCPAHTLPAMAHGTSGELTLCNAIPFRYTYLNFPAGVVPVTRVSEAEANGSKSNGDRVERGVARVTAEGAGLPVGVQVIARPYREDLALAVMAAIEGAVRHRHDYPVTPVDPKPEG